MNVLPHGEGAAEVVGPGLTIVILTRNRRDLLRGCLNSLMVQEDAGLPLEFIVVDDGSKDGTGAMVRELTAAQPRWRYFFQEQAGVAAARNTGLRLCRTEWLAFVADDYLLPPGYARAVAAFFTERPDAQAVRFRVTAASGGYVSRVLQAQLETGLVRGLSPTGISWRRRPDAGRAATGHNLEAAGAAAFRAELFRRLGGFDESYERGEDTEFTRRLRRAGIAVHYVSQVRIGHRDDTRLPAALRKAFVSGGALWRLRPGTKPQPSLAAAAGIGLRCLAALPYWPSWRAWQAGGWRGILYFPLFLILEASTRAGYLAACLRRGRPESGP